MAVDSYHPGASYALPRDQSEFDRLNVQHEYLTKAVCDGRSVYDVNVKLSGGCSVLDSGTGTGIWAIDLAKEVPESVEIHISDVSSENLFHEIPANVHFSIASATSLPSEWSNKFELVNQRFLNGALLASEWPVAIAEAYRVLKPGAAVQLMELDPRFSLPVSPVTMQICGAITTACERLGLQIGVANELAAMARAAGFVDVREDAKEVPVGKPWGELGVQGTMSFAGALRNMSQVVVKTGLYASADEFTRLIDELVSEWDVHGRHYVCKIVCARKPLH